MRKLVLFLVALIISFGTLMTISSCNKDEESCDCGTVTDYGYDGWNYWVSVRNECSGNVEYFSMDYYDWLDTWPGDIVCASDGDSWKKSVEVDPSTSLINEGKPSNPF